MKLTTTQITDREIEEFSEEAGAAGDRVAHAVCRMALGADLATLHEWLSEHEVACFERLDLDESVEAARAQVSRWISEAAAQDDSEAAS